MNHRRHIGPARRVETAMHGEDHIEGDRLRVGPIEAIDGTPVIDWLPQELVEPSAKSSLATARASRASDPLTEGDPRG